MENPNMASTGSSMKDDATSTVRRAFGFAALFGLAGVASIACTMRVPTTVAAGEADRLYAEEARLVAQVDGADTIAFPPALLARRGDPAVAKAIAEAQQRLSTERATVAAERDGIVQQITAARADNDLFESRRTVLNLKLGEALERRAAAEQRHDPVAVQAIGEQVRTLQADAAGAAHGAAVANTRVGQLSARIARLAQASRDAASRELAQVRSRLRGTSSR
ncbi:MAG: hypothetical protein DI544_03545 [Sphingomonas taxi]|uniref:AprE-like long alpha-helical hairpin domain-containing protein n=1 Tax=Sphingomonas taxi TaxID=1549858 RepID=A0A2W5QUR8_9SPHN|nr:MAG: hypothetical protein DI544_03545 [Sphingomonas taxi]